MAELFGGKLFEELVHELEVTVFTATSDDAAVVDLTELILRHIEMVINEGKTRRVAGKEEHRTMMG